MFIRIIVATLVLLLTACATMLQPTNMSSSERNAKVFPAEYTLKRMLAPFPELYAVEIVAVNGVSVKNSRRPVIIDEGQHELKVRMLPPSDGSIVGYMAANHLANKTLENLTIQVESGKRYVIKATVKHSRSALGVKTPYLYSFVIDEYEGVVTPKYPLDY